MHNISSLGSELFRCAQVPTILISEIAPPTPPACSRASEHAIYSPEGPQHCHGSREASPGQSSLDPARIMRRFRSANARRQSSYYLGELIGGFNLNLTSCRCS